MKKMFSLRQFASSIAILGTAFFASCSDDSSVSDYPTFNPNLEIPSSSSIEELSSSSLEEPNPPPEDNTSSSSLNEASSSSIGESNSEENASSSSTEELFSSSSDAESSSSVKQIKIEDLEFVTIGSLEWTKSNLDVEVDGSYCYDNKETNCEKYGRLYTWAAAMGFNGIYNETQAKPVSLPHQGICPDGSHLPNFDEWQYLYFHINQDKSAMADFMHQLAGAYDYRGYYRSIDEEVTYWSSTEYDATGTRYNFEYAWAWYIHKDYTFNKDNGHKITGASVRCVKNYNFPLYVSSSSSEQSSSSTESSSSNAFIPTVLPEKDYDCNTYKCVQTACLNPNMDYGEFLDTRDNQVYRTIQIGTQIWMAQNLNYADSIKTPSLKGKTFCYGNNEENCDKYGHLYTWAAAIDSIEIYNTQNEECGYEKTCYYLGESQAYTKGICPEGWHVPSDNDWKVLLNKVSSGVKDEISYLDYANAGVRLKSANKCWDTNINGEDSYGFSALASGMLYAETGSFMVMGQSTNFWSSTNTSYNLADRTYRLNIVNTLSSGAYSVIKKNSAFSIRCIKD